MLVTEIISSLLQVIVFALIPFIVFLIASRSTKGFADYIGLRPSNYKANVLAILVAIIFIAGGVGLAAFSESIREIMFDPESVSGKFRSLGASGPSLLLLLIVAWIKTSLSEEILFRGFIAKRLIKAFGFQNGNLFQSLIFALVHVLLFYFTMQAGAFFLVYIFLLSGIAAWAAGYLNEKLAGGSILPGWIAHGLGNMISYYLVAFVL